MKNKLIEYHEAELKKADGELALWSGDSFYSSEDVRQHHLKTLPILMQFHKDAMVWIESPAALAKFPSGTEADVCADIARRQQQGFAKYGVSVADNPLYLKAWLQHAYLETLDQAIYLKRAIQEMEKT